MAILISVLVLWGAFDLEGQFQIINRIEWIVSPALNFQWGPGVFALDGSKKTSPVSWSLKGKGSGALLCTR